RHVLFFFQAEDGIRDFHVTGVQTCALPICDQMLEVIDEKTGQKAFCRISEIPRNEGISIKNVFGLNDGWVGLSFYDKGLSLIKRSEERRVGKEWRSQRSPLFEARTEVETKQ